MSASSKDVLRQLDLADAKIREAFLEAIALIVAHVAIDDLQALVEAADVTAIARMLRMDSATLAPLLEAVRDSLKAGGDLEASSIKLPGSKLRVLFDVRNPIAEQWLREHGGHLVTAIGRDQREAIAIALQEGLKAGRGPRSVALDIVGRLDNGNRVGGIVGLTQQQAQFVSNARAELAGLDRNYFTRVLRDRRFDGIVRKAMDSGTSLSAADVDRLTTAYANRLLRHRGETIGRTEALQALNAGRDLAYEQAIADGTIKASAVLKVWDSAHDGRVRDTHRALSGKKVRMVDAFVSPSGARMRYPGDTSLGAGASEIIACRCHLKYKVDFLADAA